MPPGVRTALLRLLSHERGAWLWVPGLLVATALVLFGIHAAPSGISLFTHTTSLRIVVGPFSGEPATARDRAAVAAALRRGLGQHGDLSLVDSSRVAARLAAVPAAATDAASFLHAIRALNSHIGLRGMLRPIPGGLEAHLEAWDVHARHRVLDTTVRGADPAALGRALADSVQTAVFLPRRLAAATH